MIIARGENVYGAEVERVLLEHPAVIDAAVIGVRGKEHDEAVCAVLVTSRAVESAAIVDFCRQRLAPTNARPRSNSLPSSPETRTAKYSNANSANGIRGCGQPWCSAPCATTRLSPHSPVTGPVGSRVRLLEHAQH
ncbi:hypothetical protein ACIBCN_43850 [Nocardia sp. NPDC051052]|uniref:AMP-binding enzyme n=1 Tax=Nocardia sp. NPDC051052 TaxID=3364322 RepID=UPI00379C5B01